MKTPLAASRPSRIAPSCLRILATLFTLLAPGLALVRAQSTAVPGFISYQGRVTTAGGTAVGTGTPVNRKIRFKLWSSPSGTTPAELIYAEEQTATIAEGEFSVLIGQGTALASDPTKGKPTVTIGDAGVFGADTRYLGISIDDGTGTFNEISPRQQIVTSAYAFRAKYAESVGTAGTSILTVASGNVGIGTTTPQGKLDVAGRISVSGPDGVVFNAAVGADGLFSPADNILSLKAGGSDRLYIDATGRVGIGNNIPGAPLDVTGNIVASGTVASTGYTFKSTGGSDDGLFSPSDNVVTIRAANTDRVRVDASGNTTTVTVNGTLAAGNYTFTGTGGSDDGLFSTADNSVSLKTANIERVKVDGTGNVTIAGSGHLGIGTTTPGAALSFGTTVADSKISLYDDSIYAAGLGYQFHQMRFYNTSTATSARFSFLTGTAGTEVFSVLNTGRVGIGTTTPIAPLSFTDTIGQKITLWGSSTTACYGFGVNNSLLQVHTDSSVADIAFGYGSATSFTETMRIKGTGNVGIGTNNPTSARFMVMGGINQTSLVGAYLNSSGAGGSTTHGTHTMSIYGQGGIWSGDFFIATSDARTKAIVGRSDAARDLATLQRIEVTDYTYVDTVAKGTGQHKKVIAQQVEKVFPQAVSLQTEVVPDIYQKATIKDGWVALTTDLKPGERVKLVTDQGEEIHEVLEVAAGKFRTDSSAKGGQVFVYGREVKDFRTVDYDALSMLNLSATQQIKQEKDAEVMSLREENTALRARVAQLEAKDKARDERLAAIERQMQAGVTVMARPAPTTTGNGQ